MKRFVQRSIWWLLAGGLLCSLLAVATLDSLAFSDLPKTTHDARFETRCHPWGADTAKELCTPSFYRLLAEPEQYHGKIVGLTGFFIEEFGSFVLYPSQQAYAGNQGVDGIEITGLIERDKSGSLITHSPDIPDEIMDSARSRGVDSVFVVGKFDAKAIGVDIPRSGAIRLHHMVLKRRMSGS